MKLSLKSTVAMGLLAGVLFSCGKDRIAPAPEASADQPILSAANNDPHPQLDPICSDSIAIPFVSEDGSLIVNRCFGGAFQGYPQITCPPNQVGWGQMVIMGGVDLMIGNISMAPSWYVDYRNSAADIASSFNFDSNGVPLVDNDWFATDVNPVANKSQEVIRFDDINLGCFQIALRVTAVKLNLFSNIVPPSVTRLWGYNANWNTPGHKLYNGISPYLTPWCRSYCPSQWPTAEAQCENIYVGFPGATGCTTISPDVEGTTGTVYYWWSTGERTESIEVCPTATTTYTVSVADDLGVVAVKNITVSLTDAKCGNSNGNNGVHKVWVCHVPPGNPANVQDICIDWSGVPAHVERFRSPSSNPNLGHDSGCEIGRCGSNPCLQ
jgi:hypothetical protein